MKKAFTTIITSIAFSVTVYAWTNTKEAANRLGAMQVKEISFDKNSDQLTEELKKEIRDVVTEASQKGQIEEVKVLAWSDKEYPTEKNKQTREEVSLASNRLKNLKSFLNDDLKVTDVDTHNMTERPTALQKLFNTSDAKVKNAVEQTGAAPTEGNTGILDLKSQSSKAAIMVFMVK